MKTIQMISKGEDSALFITAFDEKTARLTFRSSRNPNYEQTEKISIHGELVYTNLHHFPLQLLQKFVKENE